MSLILLCLAAPVTAHSQNGPGRPNADSRTQAVTAERAHPELRWRRELILTGVGSGLFAGGLLASPDVVAVPPLGLDPAEISWSADRHALGRLDLNAKEASDWTRNAAIAFPFAIALILGEPGHRWDAFGARTVMYVETFLFSVGVTTLGKSALGRARPYAYVAESERPDDPDYDTSSASTFASMPSGHASSAWTGAGLGMTEFLLSRPDAHWAERLAIGFVGGGLAGATAVLRVEGGMHFPSDVIAGSGLGLASGIALPLVHRGRRPLPSTSAWLEMFGGALAGTLLGVALSR